MEQFDFSNLHEKEKPSDIEQYFTKAQLENLSDYEKVRYRNMKKNYEMMVKMGKFLCIGESTSVEYITNLIFFFN